MKRKKRRGRGIIDYRRKAGLEKCNVARVEDGRGRSRANG